MAGHTGAAPEIAASTLSSTKVLNARYRQPPPDRFGLLPTEMKSSLVEAIRRVMTLPRRGVFSPGMIFA
jgi:hypothetical protein